MDDLEFMEIIQEHIVVEQSLEYVLKQQQRAKKMEQPSPCGLSAHCADRNFPSKSSMRFGALGSQCGKAQGLRRRSIKLPKGWSRC
jgi:hypothetical protein